MKWYVQYSYQKLKKRLCKLSVSTLVATVLIVLITLSMLIISVISNSLSRQIIQRKTSLYCKDILSEISMNINMKIHETDSLTLYICYNETIQTQINKLNMALNDDIIVNEEKVLRKELINLTIANKFLKEMTIFTNSGHSIQLYQSALQNDPNWDVTSLKNKSHGNLYWLTVSEGNSLKIFAGRTINSLSTQKPIGYFLIRYDEQIFHDILLQKEFFNDGMLCIIDGNGTIISCNRKEQIGKTYPYIDSLTSDSVSKKLENTQEWLTSCTINDSDWQLASSIPSVSYEREIIWLRNYIMLVAFSTLIIAIIIAIIVIKQIFQPLNELGSTMEQVGKGFFDVKKPNYCYHDIGELYDYFIDMVHKIENLMKTTNQQELLLQKAELESLRMQINPHFIYNTLESIKWMAYMDNNKEIVTMVKALGDFMRSNLSGPEFITLNAELQNINCYLLIQKVRYNDKLTFNLDISPELYNAKIPKLIIQPIVENSIVHGLEMKTGNGYISLTASKEKDTLIIDIIDNGIGFSKEALDKLDLNVSDTVYLQNGGLGMRNVHQRIQMYYGKTYGLEIQSTFGVGTKVRITLPYCQKDSISFKK